MKFVRCSLCSQEFIVESNPLIDEQKQRHQEWHEHCIIQKRNTVEGNVEWINPLEALFLR
jgi:hypothetical protein